MLALLRSFISVLDEPGVAYERASLAAVCVGEGLLRVSRAQAGHSCMPSDSRFSQALFFKDNRRMV